MVGSVLVRLTGSEPARKPRLGIPGTGRGSRPDPVEVLLAKESAPGTLAAIESGRLEPGILVWIPLMAGAGDPGLVERWKRAAESKEADEKRRAVYRDMALVFAELTKGLVVWQRGLEGWMMQESQFINRWLAQGEERGTLKTLRAVLVRQLGKHLKATVPDAVRLAIEGTNDADMLNRWIDAVPTVGSFTEFQAVMRQTS